MDDLLAQQREQWNAAAPSWEANDEWADEMLGTLSSWMCEAVKLAPDTRVLDVACGTGVFAGIMAKRVGPNQVLATDLAPAMVAACRRRMTRLGLAVEVREMDAEHLDVPDAAFDVVTCRFGLMFCPEPARAAAELYRVLKPGGRFAVTVWDEPARNPFFTAIGQVLAKQLLLPAPGLPHGTPPPAHHPELVPDPKAPGPFRLAAPGDLAAVLAAGGFTHVEIAPFDMTFRWRSPAHYWELQTQMAGPLRAAVGKLTPEQLAPVRAAVLELAAANFVDGSVVFKAGPLTATGFK